MATSIIARAFRRFLVRKAAGLVPCASSVPFTVPPTARLLYIVSFILI